jgi:hypothetical protein
MATQFLLFFAGALMTMAQSGSLPITPLASPGYVALTAKGRAKWVVSSTIGPSNLIAGVFTEGSLGSLWGEDPRYFRIPERPFRNRLDNVFRATFIAHNRAALSRISFSLVSHVVGNAFSEFGPDIRKHFSQKNDLSAADK